MRESVFFYCICNPCRGACFILDNSDTKIISVPRPPRSLRVGACGRATHSFPFPRLPVPSKPSRFCGRKGTCFAKLLCQLTKTVLMFLCSVCNVPMGLSNPDIVSNNQLRASSELDAFHRADRSRVFTQKDGPYSGGWQPRYQHIDQNTLARVFINTHIMHTLID